MSPAEKPEDHGNTSPVGAGAADGSGMNNDMRPAYLGDAAEGATIAFDLPEMDTTGDRPQARMATYTGRVTAYARVNDGRGPRIEFRLDATGDRLFRCAPNLHIALGA